MKEFKHNIVIEFDYNGKRIRQRIEAKDIKQHRVGRIWTNWTCDFTQDGIKFTVYGSIDEDGDFRTSGSIDTKGHCSAFYVMAGRHSIDDIDIVAVDENICSRCVYITVRLDYDCDESLNEMETAQEVVSEANYIFRSPHGSELVITGSEICGINEESL